MKTKETFLTIDPPSGWKFGFPKAVTQEQYKEIKNLKQWCIDNGYPKEEADSYGEYFYVQINGDLSFMNENKSTREQVLAWWNNLPDSLNNGKDKQSYYDTYKANVFTVATKFSELTGSEIQNIWAVETNKIENKVIKPNQKQFKQFDKSLFKAYIDKFSDEDKLKCIQILMKATNTDECKFHYVDGSFIHK